MIGVPLVGTSLDDGVARLRLTRPEARNALSGEMCDAIVASLAEIARQGTARVVVLEGEGPAFCSGADLAAVSGPGALEFLGSFERMLEAVARFRLPTIASIHGAALGGGLQLATVCDFRLATSDSKIGIPSARLGIVINLENVQRLVLLVGVAVAKEILMTARTFTGHDAARLGLVNSAYEPAELDTAVGGLAYEIAALAPLSVQGAKRAIGVVGDALAPSRSGTSGSPEDVDALVAAAYRSTDLAEGLQALSENRPPNFSGT